ncbi:MAG: helix-turn-helix transcriptional regulator [Bacteroidota bacterium]
MSSKKEPTYEELRKTLTDKEIAESFVFRSAMTEEEKEQAEEEMRRLRFEQMKNRSDQQILRSELMRMRLLMKDYFKQSTFLDSFSFSNQLKNYIDLLKKTRKEFASDIQIHTTKLSRILNDRENPSIEMMYRLEYHSGEMIPANYWFRLHSRKLEDEINRNQEKRKEEYKRVRNKLVFHWQKK